VKSPTLYDLDLSAGSVRVLKYVPWDQLEAYQALGWIYLYEAPAHHCFHAAILEWSHRENPRFPE
jgi:hypothetical protein